MDKEMKEIREKLGVLVEEFLDSDSSSNEGSLVCLFYFFFTSWSFTSLYSHFISILERRSIQISSSSSSESEEEKVEPKLTKSQEIMLKKR